MALSNAERQRRYIQRLKAKAGVSDGPGGAADIRARFLDALYAVAEAIAAEDLRETEEFVRRRQERGKCDDSDLQEREAAVSELARIRDRTVLDPLLTNWSDGGLSDDPAYEIVRRLLEDAGNARPRYEKLIARKAREAAKEARRRARAARNVLTSSSPSATTRARS